MKQSKQKKSYVLCVRNDDADDLQELKLYQVLPDEDAAEDGLLRIVDDSGEDFLYPKSYFVSIELPQTAKRMLSSSAKKRKSSKLVPT